MLTSLLPFQEALNALGVRVVLPSSLDTAAWRQVDPAIRRRSLYSAQTMLTDYLDQVKADLESLINPVTVMRDGRSVTEGYDQATVRLRAKELLQRLNYSPDPGERGTLKDFSSDQRINLVLETNVQMMQGIGQFIKGQSQGVIEAFPAQELVRFESRKTERNWKERWLLAATYSGDSDAARVLQTSGRMIARKDSPIWDALGSSDLFQDGLDNPYPPFAFGSGMWIQGVDFATAQQLGLVTPNNIPEPQKLDIESLFSE